MKGYQQWMQRGGGWVTSQRKMQEKARAQAQAYNRQVQQKATASGTARSGWMQPMSNRTSTAAIGSVSRLTASAQSLVRLLLKLALFGVSAGAGMFSVMCAVSLLGGDVRPPQHIFLLAFLVGGLVVTVAAWRKMQDIAVWSGVFEGLVVGLQDRAEAKGTATEYIQSFRLAEYDVRGNSRERHQVILRGRSIQGNLQNNDRVRVWGVLSNGGILATRVENLSTNSEVVALGTSIGERIGRLISIAIGVLVIFLLLSFLVAVFSG